MLLLARRSQHRSTYPGLWSFPGGHVERDETLTDALMREVREEIGVIPTSFSFLTTIADPNAAATDPATYHMYAITAWDGGEPALLGGEHTELSWFTPARAITQPDLALDKYRSLFADIATPDPSAATKRVVNRIALRIGISNPSPDTDIFHRI